MRDRLLTEHFLRRFVENDLLSPEADSHSALAMVCGGLLTLGLFLSVLISLKFLFMPFQSPARTAALAVDDRVLFITLSMIVMALVAVTTWDALSLDPRDTAILGPLPIERGVIVLAKLRAVAVLAVGFSLALSSLSSVFHPTLMVAKLTIGVVPALALIAVHLLVTLAAGLFGFAAVVVIREVLRAALGARFARVSALLQSALIVALVAGLLLLPAVLSRAARTESRLVPPLWFAGLQEQLAGKLVMSMTPQRLPRLVARQEEGAAVRYRETAARLRPLAWRAPAGLALMIAVAVAAYFWNSRELPLPLVGQRRRRHPPRRLLARAATLTFARAPATRAGFFFALHCLFLSPPHRVAMACCTAVSLAVATVMLASAGGPLPRDVRTMAIHIFSTQTIALAVLLAGFRHATRLPADVRANRYVRTAWVADGARFAAGVRHAGLLTVVLPVVILLLPAHVYLMGTTAALMHGLTGALLGAAAITLLISRAPHLPLVAGYAPAQDLPSAGPVMLIGGMFVLSIFSRMEREALADLRSAAVLWTVLALVAVVPNLAGRRRPQFAGSSAFDVPAPGTTRLDLG
ncbi:MAG TPA: hypothetical protein VE379_12010 [Vicinamibacterales bacterium]|nr:hypothetical protein [Vicinamibacterales bacterium]